jgi:hypothetical protein
VRRERRSPEALSLSLQVVPVSGDRHMLDGRIFGMGGTGDSIQEDG